MAKPKAPPPPALPAELLASLPPPPPQAEQGTHAADLAELRACQEELERTRSNLGNAQGHADELKAMLAETRAQLEACEAALKEARAELAQRPETKAERHDPNRRNWVFELTNGSRRIVSATNEKQARAKLGPAGEGAAFKGCA